MKFSFSGKIIEPNGKENTFTATYLAKENKEKKINDSKDTPTSPKITTLSYPNMAYGFKTAPKQETILFKNLTVWTNEKEGILENTDVLIKDGKIAKMFSNFCFPWEPSFLLGMQLFNKKYSSQSSLF